MKGHVFWKGGKPNTAIKVISDIYYNEVDQGGAYNTVIVKVPHVTVTTNNDWKVKEFSLSALERQGYQTMSCKETQELTNF